MKKHKTGLTFALILIGGGLLGAGAGVGLIYGEETLRVLGAQLGAALQRNALWGLLLAAALLGGLAVQRLAAGRRAVALALAGPEEEGLFDRADRLCEQGMAAVNVLNILCFFFMGAGCTAALENQETAGRILWLAAAFLAITLGGIFLTSRLVALTKTLYPEKRGDVLSVKFQKDWMDSCDEAERARIGQAAYRALRATQSACLSAWVVAVLLGMIFGTGLLPIALVTAIWLVQTLSYLRAAKGRAADVAR